MPTNDDTPTIDNVLYKHWEEIIKQVEHKPNRKSDIQIEKEAKSAIQNLIDRARINERSIFIKDEEDGRNGKYIALLK